MTFAAWPLGFVGGTTGPKGILACVNGTSNRWRTYQFGADGTIDTSSLWVPSDSPSAIGTTGKNQCAFSKGGEYLVFGAGSAASLQFAIYGRDGLSFSKEHSTTISGVNVNAITAFKASGGGVTDKVMVGLSGSPYLNIYEKSGGSWTKMTHSIGATGAILWGSGSENRVGMGNSSACFNPSSSSRIGVLGPGHSTPGQNLSTAYTAKNPVAGAMDEGADLAICTTTEILVGNTGGSSYSPSSVASGKTDLYCLAHKSNTIVAGRNITSSNLLMYYYDSGTWYAGSISGTLPSGKVQAVALTSDAQYMFAGDYGGNILSYKRTATDTFTYVGTVTASGSVVSLDAMLL